MLKHSRTRLRTAFQKLDGWLKKHLRIYGALRLSSPGDWGRAAIELVITLIFALFPVWVTFIVYPMFGVEGGSYSNVLYDQIKHGELYLLTTALLAPIFYFTFPGAVSGSASKATQFPSHRVLILIFMFTLVLSVLAIAASKLQTGAEGIPPRMVYWSAWLFGLSCLLYYLTLTVKNWFERGGAENILDEQSREEDRRSPDPDRIGEAPAPEPDNLVAETLAANVVPADEPGDAQ